MTLGFLEVRVQSSSKPFIEYTTEKIYIYIFILNSDKHRSVPNSYGESCSTGLANTREKEIGIKWIERETVT